MLRGKKSDQLTRHILELFARDGELTASAACNELCGKYKVTRKTVRSRLQRLRDHFVLVYTDPNCLYSALPMKMTLHGEYTLLHLRAHSDDPRSLTEQKLAAHVRWGKRRKKAS